MKPFVLLVAALAVGVPSYQTDLSRYFADRTTEQSQRAPLLARAQTFVLATSTPATPQALTARLQAYEALLVALKQHHAYLYLLAEEDQEDHAAEAADDAVGSAMDRLGDAVGRTLLAIGPERLRTMTTTDPSLASYRHFIDLALERAAHSARNPEVADMLVEPVLSSLTESYKSLLPKFQQATAVSDLKASFDAKWAPFAQNETAFAAVLIPIVRLRDGEARLKGYAGAPEAAYASAGLTSQEVDSALAAVTRTDAAKRYDTVVAAAAARRLGIGADTVQAWDMQAADSYQPPAVAFPDAIPLVLAAEQSMGQQYAGAYARLFDPHAHRVEWCHEPHCDRTGFSMGFAGVESTLFYGAYRGDTNSIRAVAHEAGHAVHRQFMNENQRLAVYNSGPQFMFESFAIFNELLLLDHLYQEAPTPEAKAYFLHRLLDDMTFQIYGSAQETDLERSIYEGVRANAVHSSADLDALTLKVFARYRAGSTLNPEMRVYWARNRLFFTDPLYGVNYLFAGLLAVQYLQRYEADPRGFSDRYVALLKNGFTDTSEALEKRFLGIDLDDSDRLAKTAATVIDQRTTALEALYRR